MKFLTTKEAELGLNALSSGAEKMKLAAKMLAPAEAFCDYYKTALKTQISSEQQNKAAINTGEKIVESRLKRIACATTEYSEAARTFRRACELKVFLRVHIGGLKMAHDSELARERRVTAEIKAGIYKTGS